MDDENLEENAKKSAQEMVGVITDIKIESSTAVALKPRGPKRKSNFHGKTASQSTIKKSSKIEKKNRGNISRSSAILEKNSSTFVKKRYFNKYIPKTNNLVEIYHNDAVKNSDSDESNLKKSRQHQDRKMCGEATGVPPLNITISNPLDGMAEPVISKTAKTDEMYQNGLINHFPYDHPDGPRNTVSCCYSKNYELPTVASRMKQVAKSYLTTLNFKTIPFCAAISTTQSHNIGINIQQVMNIIKNRQPINGISPTLAHNIGLAAEKMNNKPFSTLVSTINSKIA